MNFSYLLPLKSAFEWVSNVINDAVDFTHYASQVQSLSDAWELFLWAPLWIEIFIISIIFGLGAGLWAFVFGAILDNEP